jgi:adenylate cyclase, class 2
MLEVEAKARVASLVAARARCAALGGQRLGREEQRDTYYAHPVRDFAATDEALRLREAWGAAELTYKGPKLDAATKTREELTVAVEPPLAAAQVLERLGFRPVAVVAKWRETWKVGAAEVCLDEVEGLGSFVEVERRAEDPAALPALRQEVLALLEQLGGQERLRTSYLELLLARPKP